MAAKFNPDAYLADQSPSSGFNPDAYLAGTPQPSQGQPSNVGLQDVADTVSKGLNFINNPGGGPPAGTQATGPQGDNLFQKLGDKTNTYLNSKDIPGNPYTAALAGTAISMANPENWLTNPAAIPNKVQLPGAGTAEDMAQGAARRTLGYTKGMLKKPGALDRANQVGQTMLDQDVIKNPITNPLSFGAEDTYGRASDLADTSGQAIGNVISGLAGKPSIDTNAVGMEVSNQLFPKYSGGVYDAQKNVVNEIMDTIGAHGNGPISFDSAQALKQKLGEAAQFSKNTDAMKADMYRRAYGIVNDALDKSIQGATEGTATHGSYQQNKAVYGASKEAEKALLNRMSSEAGNKRIGLTDTVAAAGELAAGHPGVAAGLIGIKHGVENAGNALTARTMDYLARSGTLGKPGINAGLADIIAAYVQSRNQGRQ